MFTEVKKFIVNFFGIKRKKWVIYIKIDKLMNKSKMMLLIIEPRLYKL